MDQGDSYLPRWHTNRILYVRFETGAATPPPEKRTSNLIKLTRTGRRFLDAEPQGRHDYRVLVPLINEGFRTQFHLDVKERGSAMDTSRIQSKSPLSKLSRFGLQMLLEASEYAHELQRDVWDFAVELSVLQKAGLSTSDLRWLVCKGFAKQARETTLATDAVRSFQHQEHLALRKRSCFVLTDLGVELVRRTLTHVETNKSDSFMAAEQKRVPPYAAQPRPQEQPLTWPMQGEKPLQGENGRARDAGPIGKSLDSGTKLEALKPTWDCDRQELRIRDIIVKVFKLNSPNQSIILTAFEEEGWPPRIDDPLPPHAEIDAKQRLHDTIKSLNRNQKARIIRFRGDGTGQGIRWELATSQKFMQHEYSRLQ